MTVYGNYDVIAFKSFIQIFTVSGYGIIEMCLRCIHIRPNFREKELVKEANSCSSVLKRQRYDMSYVFTPL